MSRIASMPVVISSGVEVTISPELLVVKGSKGELTCRIHPLVEVVQEGSELRVKTRNSSKEATAQAGTVRAITNNLVQGVTVGFEKKLILVGVGYRAQVQGSQLNLSLGFSHPVVYELPQGVVAETPSQTEIILRSIDKQRLGQVAAEIRAYRPPEPYKGKGIRYADERVVIKETKKK